MAHTDPAARKAYLAGYRKANPGKVKAYHENRKLRRALNRDVFLAKEAEQRLKNREARLARGREHYFENREQLKAAADAYRVANPDKIMAYRQRAAEWRKTRIHRELLKGARTRAKRRGMECSLSEDDITIPEICPVLGMPLRLNCSAAGHDSPTIDRIDNSKGYVPGNVIVVSYRANSIKRDATLEELQAIVDFYRWLLPAKEKGPGFPEPSSPPSYDDARPHLALTADMADERAEVN